MRRVGESIPRVLPSPIDSEALQPARVLGAGDAGVR